MKFKTLAILAAGLAISTSASALTLDFESPSPFVFPTGGYTTGYQQVFSSDAMEPEGTVAVGTNPAAFHNLFKQLPNSSNNLLFVNGASTELAVLTYTSLTAAGSYVFKADLMNICCQDSFPSDAGSKAVFQISYNNGGSWQDVGSGSTVPGNVGNLQAMAPISFVAANPFIFRIIDDLTAPDGNDFGIDNISLDARAVPGPIVGAGLPGLILALGGLVALSRRRRNYAIS
jgi:hypothetical protein